jgi:uncharacterized iron-regulated protein
MEEIESKKLVFFGEMHSVPQIVALQTAIQERLIAKK